MKKLIILISVMTSLNIMASEAEIIDQSAKLEFSPTVGVGGNFKGVSASVKAYSVKFEQGSDVKIETLGLGYSVGSVKGVIVSPINVRLLNYGVGLDFQVKDLGTSGNISFNYSF